MSSFRVGRGPADSVRTGAGRVLAIAGLAWSLALVPAADAQQKLHFTYLWHLEQPIYWPDKQVSQDRYERLAESLARAGAHPEDDLNSIFGEADRVAIYQTRARDSISSWAAFPTSGSIPEGGAQISYTGGLIENIMSVAGTSWISGQYTSNWNSALQQARGWSTFGGPAVPRADLVLFPFHHPLIPLIDANALHKEIQIYKAIYTDAWGTAQPMSQGMFPSEMAFAERTIPILASEGVNWIIVSGEHVSRACSDFPVILGSGGINCDPPNLADQTNPAQGTANYYRLTISRGCAPAEAYPFAFTPHRAQFVDPDTGVVSSIIVVPASQSLGWQDGYSAQGISDFDNLQARNDPTRPELVVLAHDGDNAWGGGYSYYMEATPNRVSQASAAGYVPTVIQRYLADHPVPANDIIKVEQGPWVNADGDFGSPQMLNWNWPLLNSSGQIDIPNGWHVDERNWAVITAAQNRVDTAEAILLAQGGSVDPRKIVYPETGANPVERAWHYFLASLNSGYMYYGTAEDMEVKQTVACNNAVRLTDPFIAAAGSGADTVGPTIWALQRHPWNPGSLNFGPQYGYQQSQSNGDFYVWTFAYDVSGVASVTLYYRTSATIPGITDTSNKTYAGGAPWQSILMTDRPFPAGNVYNDPTIDFFEMPTYIADEYSAQIVGVRSALVDYYVQAVDTLGNVKRSPIEHVWVGDGSGGTGGGGTVVTTTPAPPTAGQQVTVKYDPTGRNLATAAAVYMHWGTNNWTGVSSPDPAMTGAAGGPWTITVTLPSTATELDCVFNNGSGTWDNNSNANWVFQVTPVAQTSGSCCVSGACTVVTQAACTGTFTANATCGTGGTICPPPPTGSCCTGGGCTVVAQSSCSASSAVWTSGGVCSPNPCPFVMDGTLDSGTVQVAANGSMFLNASLRGDVLYVAAPNSPTGNDRFIYLAPIGGPGAPQPANWAKNGTIAAWSCFLSAENDNSYVGWQQQLTSATTAAAKGTVLEGTINLRQQFGLAANAALPQSVWLAFAQYPTADHTNLVATLQVPASVNNDGNIDAGEYVKVNLCALTQPQTCCRADFNGDGVRSVQDIFDYLAAWFGECNGTQAGTPCNGRNADFNGSGSITVQDIFDFLAAWFAGC